MGDYLNAASHLVSASALDSIASKFSGLVDTIWQSIRFPILMSSADVSNVCFPFRTDAE
jgi:hypothetical protein